MVIIFHSEVNQRQGPSVTLWSETRLPCKAPYTGLISLEVVLEVVLSTSVEVFGGILTHLLRRVVLVAMNTEPLYNRQVHIGRVAMYALGPKGEVIEIELL